MAHPDAVMAEDIEKDYGQPHSEHSHDTPQEIESLQYDYAQFDLPLLEYARLHELTTDYTASSPFNRDLVPLPPVTWESNLDDSNLTSIGLLLSLSALNGDTVHEKLDIDKDSAGLLVSVFKLGQDDDFLDEWQKGSVRLNDLKLDEPLLGTDPRLDLLQLENRNRAAVCADGTHLLSPEDIVDLGFMDPKKDAEMRVELQMRNHEKLDIDRTIIEYLGDVCKRSENSGDCGDEDEVETLLSRRENRFPSPETPPLLTSSPTLQAVAPSLQADEMELTSSPEDLIQQEAVRVEQEIINNDSSPSYTPRDYDQPGDVDMSIYDIPKSPNENSSSPLQRKRLRDIKVEVPLTPEDSHEPAVKKTKTVSFSETLQTMIPPLDSDLAVSEPGLDDGELEDFIQTVVEPSADSALKQIEEEQLEELDTTLRLPVPHKNDIALHVPWEMRSLDQTNASLLESHRTILSAAEKDLDGHEKKWSGVQRTERHLPWTPFPTKLGQIDIEENLDDCSIARYFGELEMSDDLDIESIICAPAHSIADQDESDDSIIEVGEPVDSGAEDTTNDEPLREAASKLLQQPVALALPTPENSCTLPEGRLDMQTLLKRRKLELEATNNKSPVPTSVSKPTGRTETVEVPAQTVATKPTRLSELSGGLANFLHHHGGPQSANLPHIRTALQEQRIPPASATTSASNDKTGHGRQETVTLPAPTVENTANVFFLIVSPTIMADRNLMREIRKSFPAVEIVTRDLLPLDTNQTTQIVNNEADITTSPSTGILTMTLQKLKQMPLPGQSAFFGVRERIALVSDRYSRLLVLVSEGRKQDIEAGTTTGPLDNRDVKAISNLIGFVTSMDNEVEVQFVAGGEPQLATWIAASIGRTAIMDQSIRLMQDESIWERTLRQAGFNPFAAQYILAKLKPNDVLLSPDGSSTGKSGLAAFMQMTVSQRIEMFGEAVGRKVIVRTSAALGGSFVPSAQKDGAQ